MNTLVSVIIPTFNRAPFLTYALEALKRQTYRNFEVIVVVKPGGDETDKVLEKYSHELPLKIIVQNEEFVSKAYNMGLKEAKGDIIAIMDDDSVPFDDWLEKHLQAYRSFKKLGGISGSALNAKINAQHGMEQIPETASMYMRWRDFYYSSWSYNRPLHGMSNWWIFFGRDGLVHQRPLSFKETHQQAVRSLLLMGANMSVKKEAISGLKIEEDLILGFSYEQLLAYQIWRRGYELMHDPTIKVHHIIHAESLGRFFKSPSRAAHRDAEYILSFFIIKPSSPEVSWVPFALELVSLVISRALNAKKYGFNVSIARIYGLVYGTVVGCGFYLSKLSKGNFSIKTALRKFVK
jgi:glycosyltransferase involved in cell wall biosynthesis